MATTLKTNKKDYLPGETVTFTLGEFGPGSSFVFAVRDSASDPGDDGVANVYTPFWVTDGGWGDLDGLVNGQIVAQWVVPADPDGPGPQVAPALHATLEATASSASTSGTGGVVVASTTFTDAGPNPPPVQLYYVPEPEDQLLQALQSIENGGPSTAPSSPVTNYISIAVAASGTIIYYDQGENGYVNDIANPTAAEIYDFTSNRGGVQIWGNGIASDGVAPGYASDLLSAGNVIVLQSTVPVPTPMPLPTEDFYFDGGDKIGVSKSVAVTRTGWAEGPRTLLAGSVEVLDTSKWGTEYRVPVGVDVSGGASKFQYTGLFIMAGEQGATISVDRNANGNFTDPDDLNVSLSEGQSQLVDGNVNVGAKVVSDKPVQVVMLTGDIASNYESRDSSLLPTSLWTNSYYTPVSTVLDPPDPPPPADPITTSGTQVWLYNPGASAITVNYEWRVGSGAIATGSVSVPGSGTAGGYTSVALPANVGAHFYTTGATPPNFYAFSATDATGTSGNNQAWDWGFTLIPESSLTSQVLVGLGLGRDPTSSTNPSENGNPLWITPVGNGEKAVTVYVDYNGDNLTNSGPVLTDPNGNNYDISYNLKELQQQKVYDPDGNQTGMLAYVLTPGVKLAAAWGQDPATASAGNPGLDVGTSVLPLPLFDAGKNGTLSIDNDGNEVISAGDEILYTITINNISRAVVSDILLKDVFPANTTYVANSTFFTNELNVTTPIADAGTTAFPLDEGGVIINPSSALPVGATYKVTFKVVIDPLANLGGVTTIINKGDATAGGVTVPFEDTTPLSFVSIQKEVSADGNTWFDADDPTGPVIPIGQLVYYRVVVTNDGALPATVDLEDQIIVPVVGPGLNFTFGGGNSQTATVNPGTQVTTNVITILATAGQHEDRVSVIATVNDGGVNKPIKVQPDDANYFGSQGGIKIVKSVNGDDANSPTGPNLAVGSTANFSYVVTNTGNVALSGVTVTDDRLSGITFTGGDSDSDGLLDTTETWTYTASETVAAGQYTNIGTATGAPTNPDGSVNPGATPVSDDDPANYFGSQGGIKIVKSVNGDDANSPTGPNLAVGSTANFSYVVTNTGNVALSGVTVTDDRLSGITFTGGDSDSDGLLDTTETWTYTASETVAAGQYTNIGTATGAPTNPDGSVNPGATPVSDDDPANYFGSQGGIKIVKSVNGDDANSPTGPNLAVGSTANFSYVVTNTGNVALSGVTVTDDRLSGITFTGGDSDSDGLLDTTETWTYTASETVAAGQYTNIGTATGAPTNPDGSVNPGATPVSDDDPANYFGSQGGIKIVKSVNGDDANSPTGPNLAVGSTANFSYVVTNTGNVALSGVTVTDDRLSGITFTGGDSDSDGLLDTTETWTYTASETVAAGQYTNIGTATGAPTNPDGSVNPGATPVSDDDPANYFGSQGGIKIVKSVNGDDANSPTGPNLAVGSTANFSYVVTNTGNVALSGVTVTDDRLSGITFTGGDSDSDGLLDTTETWTYTASETVAAGQYTNIGTATGAPTNPDGSVNPGATPVSDDDPANYFGFEPTGSIGDFVWEDLDYDGIQDANEKGIAGVTVNLLDTNGNVVKTTQTDSGNNLGKYLFDNVAPGDYSIQVVKPSNDYFFTKPNVSGDDALDSDVGDTGVTAIFNLSAGENDLTVDAGLYRKASLGDRVWLDRDNDGIQDLNEKGVDKVKVKLLDSSGAQIAMTTTDASGKYLFGNLDPGSYTLEFDKSAALTGAVSVAKYPWGKQDQGGDDTLDSDVTGAGFKATVSVVLESGENDLTQDAAITPIVIDLNGDGIKTIARSDSQGTFDLLGTGSGINSGWLSGDDGFLVIDRNGNGNIDDISEMFGGSSKGDGFAKLASFDSNGDGVVDAKDADFAGLKIWRDVNGNHQTDDGELMSLADAGLVGLSISYSELPFLDAKGNLHLERGSATRADGSVVDMTDVYFNISASDAAAAGVQALNFAELMGGDSSFDSLMAHLDVAAVSAEQQSDTAIGPDSTNGGYAADSSGMNSMEVQLVGQAEASFCDVF